MSYCKKGIDAIHIAQISQNEIEFTLASCEQSCDRYYQCDTVALMLDELKKREEEEQ